jgi:hypothetical protein
MCLKVTDKDKAQAAPGFPDGWTFLFRNPPEKHDPVADSHKGLLLLTTNSRRYKTVHRAKTHQPTKLENVDPAGFYAHVGLGDGVDADEGSLAAPTVDNTDDRKPRGLSAKIEVNSRCYSRFANGQWYWGMITNVVGKGKFARYSIKYDDGDTLDAVPWTDIISEKQYQDEFNEDPREVRPSKRQKLGFGDEGGGNDDDTSSTSDPDDSAGLSLRDLRMLRCYSCFMCRKADCGKCNACKDNKSDTSIYKNVCLFKMCDGEDITAAKKAQPVPKLSGFKFYFTDPSNLRPEWRNRALHPRLEGLCVMSASGVCYSGVDTAVKALKCRPAKANEIVQHFAEKHLKIAIRLEREHELVGKWYFREWTDIRGRNRGPPKQIFGQLTACHEDYFDRGSLNFTVEYDALSREDVLTAGDTFIPTSDNSITEKEAYGGCLLFDKKFQQHNLSDSPPCKLSWILPR